MAGHDTVKKIRHVMADIYKLIIRILRQHPVDLRLFFIKLTAFPVIPGRNLCNMLLQKIGKLRPKIQLRIRQNRHSKICTIAFFIRISSLTILNPYSFYPNPPQDTCKPMAANIFSKSLGKPTPIWEAVPASPPAYQTSAQIWKTRKKPRNSPPALPY